MLFNFCRLVAWFYGMSSLDGLSFAEVSLTLMISNYIQNCRRTNRNGYGRRKSTTRVQILNEAVCVLPRANVLGKAMEPSLTTQKDVIKGLYFKTFLSLVGINMIRFIWLSIPAHWPNGYSDCQWPRRPEFNPRSSHAKTPKNGTWSLFSIMRYGLRVKWSNPEEVVPSPTRRCSDFRSPSTTVANVTYIAKRNI